jgi:hypothetical protein
MARTNIPVVEMVANSNIADPAGTAVDPANGHVITMANGGLEELYIEINSTFAGAKTFTFKAGANPPALSAGQGDLVVTLNAAVGIVGPLSSARFAQKDGSLQIDVAAAATGTIKAIHLPRTA